MMDRWVTDTLGRCKGHRVLTRPLIGYPSLPPATHWAPRVDDREKEKEVPAGCFQLYVDHEVIGYPIVSPSPQ